MGRVGEGWCGKYLVQIGILYIHIEKAIEMGFIKFVKKVTTAWQKFKSSMKNQAWTGVSAIVGILALIVPIVLFVIDNNPEVSESPIPPITSPLVTHSPTKETPSVTVQPTPVTTVVPTMTPISPTQEKTLVETKTPLVSSNPLVTPCLSDVWKPYPNSLSPLVKNVQNGCLDFKDIRFDLEDKTLRMYANPPFDTNLVGIYTMIPEGEWHKVFEIQLDQIPMYADGRSNYFFIGFIDPSASKLTGKYLEIYTTYPQSAIGRLFAKKVISQQIFTKSKIILDCEITDLGKTTCSITIDDGLEQVFENVLPDDQSINAFFIGYYVYYGTTLEITVTDKSIETIFR